jgi:hypothetical protein
VPDASALVGPQLGRRWQGVQNLPALRGRRVGVPCLHRSAIGLRHARIVQPQQQHNATTRSNRSRQMPHVRQGVRPRRHLVTSGTVLGPTSASRAKGPTRERIAPRNGSTGQKAVLLRRRTVTARHGACLLQSQSWPPRFVAHSAVRGGRHGVRLAYGRQRRADGAGVPGRGLLRQHRHHLDRRTQQ